MISSLPAALASRTAAVRAQPQMWTEPTEPGVDDGEKEGDDPIARNGQCDGGHHDLSGDDEVAREVEAQEVRTLRPGEAGAGCRPDLRSCGPEEDPGRSSDE